MKSTIALGFALSVLTTAAFASPHSTVSQPAVAAVSTQSLDSHLADVGDKNTQRFQADLKSPLIVAENRKEFGSRYQRY
jgi:hypothetical protein